MKITCCIQCQNRHMGCHAECDEYKKQKEQLTAEKKEQSELELKRILPDKVLYSNRAKARKKVR